MSFIVQGFGAGQKIITQGYHAAQLALNPIVFVAPARSFTFDAPTRPFTFEAPRTLPTR